MMSNLFEKEVAALLPWRKGHYKFESGHHGDTWLNLELLCVQPEPVEQLATVLAWHRRGFRLYGRGRPTSHGVSVESSDRGLFVKWPREAALERR